MSEQPRPDPLQAAMEEFEAACVFGDPGKAPDSPQDATPAPGREITRSAARGSVATALRLLAALRSDPSTFSGEHLEHLIRQVEAVREYLARPETPPPVSTRVDKSPGLAGLLTQIPAGFRVVIEPVSRA